MEYLPYLVIIPAEEIGTHHYQYNLRNDVRDGVCVCRCLGGIEVEGGVGFCSGEWVTMMTCRKVGVDQHGKRLRVG